MKIVGIDASLTSTGIAVLKNDDLQTEAIKSLKIGPDRLIELRDKVKSIVADADLVVIEGYAFARANQAHQMGELGGVLRTMLREQGIRWIEVAPTAVKKFATGKGNGTKEAVAVSVYKRWKKEFNTNDEADAFVLAMIGYAYLTGKSKDAVSALTAFQQEVIDGLKGIKSAKKSQKTSRRKGAANNENNVI